MFFNRLGKVKNNNYNTKKHLLIWNENNCWFYLLCKWFFMFRTFNHWKPVDIDIQFSLGLLDFVFNIWNLLLSKLVNEWGGQDWVMLSIDCILSKIKENVVNNMNSVNTNIWIPPLTAGYVYQNCCWLEGIVRWFKSECERQNLETGNMSCDQRHYVTTGLCNWLFGSMV